jgi:hypothetical protein
MSCKVYLHKPATPDELLGRMDEDGKAYETRFGPDRYIGRVDISNGKIYASRPGPDKHIGEVALETGKVFTARFGPDDYVGRVQADGDLYLHKPVAPDQYIGREAGMPSYAHGGAALLLLVLPEIQKPAEPGEAQ